MSSATIERVWAREILDSRGRPTVEADVILANGTLGRASVPSGASTGTHEAVELRDEEPGRYAGLGVRRAVENVRDVLGPAVRGLESADQARLDSLLIELDSTPNKSRLGANAILAVSLAACRAAALNARLALYRHIAAIAEVEPTIPLPMINIVSGGLHAGGQIEIQDVLAMPLGARTFGEALEQVWRVHHAAGERVRREGHPPLVGDEGGWAPPFSSNEQALEWVSDAIVAAGLRPGEDVAIAIDVAATHFFDPARQDYVLHREQRRLSSSEMVDMLAMWRRAYPVVSIEDGLAEDDWSGWQALARRLGASTQLVGDDLFTTDVARVEQGISGAAANAVLVKVNQIGTLTEALRVVRRAREVGWRSVASARSGETEDAFLSDFAVGCAADQVKVGSVTRSSRLAKWNQLLRSEEEL
ncbi:MAG TPA: phosphopyruvate hydratase, partial [Chloroflexota bacterium]|nr:phosphopyruvate hydratase [Chloroflexota bacterium]